MSIPTYEECMLPLMKIAEDGKEHLFKDAIDEISKQFNLTDSERQELLPSGSAFVINSRASWAQGFRIITTAILYQGNLLVCCIGAAYGEAAFSLLLRYPKNQPV